MTLKLTYINLINIGPSLTLISQKQMNIHGRIYDVSDHGTIVMTLSSNKIFCQKWGAEKNCKFFRGAIIKISIKLYTCFCRARTGWWDAKENILTRPLVIRGLGLGAIMWASP